MDSHEIMMNIYERAKEYPDGPTQLNIFRETVFHLVTDKFAGLYKQYGDKPSAEQLGEALVKTCDEIYNNNPNLINEENLESCKQDLKKKAENFRPLFNKVAERMREK